MSRRELHLSDLNQAVAECHRLLNSGYDPTGNWTLGQICRHIRRTIESNLEGYPAWMSIIGFPLRPLLRWFALPKLLNGKSPAGIRTATRYVPAPGLDDRQEIKALEQCVDQFARHQGRLYAHPGFGQLGRAGFEQFHAAHMAHHLSFLNPIQQQR